MKVKGILRKEDGSITIWFILMMFVFVTIALSLFEVFELIYYRHAIDAATESAALCGASNVVETLDFINNTSQLKLNRQKADSESRWLFDENIRKNGLSNAFVVKDFITEVETDHENRQWYKCKAIVKLKVFKTEIQYVSISKGEFNKRVIQK